MLSKIFSATIKERERLIIAFLKSKGLKARWHSFSINELKHCNIWINFKGQLQKTIVISTHYDGIGAYDNACGVATLLYLIESFISYRPKHNFVYCFFDCEEEGQMGSKLFLQDFPNRRSVVQHLEIDGSGIGDCLVGVSNFTSLPLQFGEKIIVVPSSGDFASFISHNIPSLHLFSLPMREAKLFVEKRIFPETLYILHTEEDNLTKVDNSVNRRVASCLKRIISKLDNTKTYFKSCSLLYFPLKKCIIQKDEL